MLEDVFPGSQPDLNSLSKEAVLFINHGSPFTGDGLRYTLPQFNVLSIFYFFWKNRKKSVPFEQDAQKNVKPLLAY